MPDLNSTKFKHMTLDDRIEIQLCLDHGVSFSAIPTCIGQDQTTISKKVNRHISINPSIAKKFDKHGNPIVNIRPLLIKAPFVCNPCRNRHAPYGFQKQLYNAKVAQKNYETLLARIGRTYEAFLAFIEENAVTHWTEMDTVIGRVGGKVIMTFDFTLCNFMFGLLLGDKSSLEVSEKATNLKAVLTGRGFVFGDIIPLALTDNGGEFSNISAIEFKGNFSL